MRLNDKLFELTAREIKVIEKQLRKKGFEPKRNWYKTFLIRTEFTEAGDTFIIAFNRKTKHFFCSCSMLHDTDIFDDYVGEVIALNRLALQTDFQKEVCKEEVKTQDCITVNCVNCVTTTLNNFTPVWAHTS